MMKRILTIISCILLFVMVAAGCGSNETGGTKAPAAKTIKIGLAMPQIDEITQNLYGSYEAYAETLQGVEIILTDAEGSAEQQSKDIESLISQNCDVIIIRAVDGDSITAACDAAANANIPLVIDGTPVATSNYAAFVSENQSTHGRLHGEYLQGLLDKGDIKDVRIGYIAGDSNADMLKRMTGISDTCPSATFTAEIEKGYALAENWSAEEARGIVESWISSGLINDMNVIACMDAALANAVVAALGDDYSDMIVLGAGADNPLIWQNIEDGKIKATTRQDNTVLVKKVMDTCVDLAGGVEITFDEPASRIVDPQNITLMTAETISDE